MLAHNCNSEISYTKVLIDDGVDDQLNDQWGSTNGVHGISQKRFIGDYRDEINQSLQSIQFTISKYQ